MSLIVDKFEDDKRRFLFWNRWRPDDVDNFRIYHFTDNRGFDEGDRDAIAKLQVYESHIIGISDALVVRVL